MQATSQSSRASPAEARSRWRPAAVLALVVLVALFAWFRGPIGMRARAEASYGARIACSCRYVAGRSLSDCRNDLLPGMGLVMLGEDETERSVTATFPLLARETARFREGRGCVLEPWQD